MGGDGDFTALRGRQMKPCRCFPLGAQLGEAACLYSPSPSCPLSAERLEGEPGVCQGLPFPPLAKKIAVPRPCPCQGLAPYLQSSTAKKLPFRERK